MQMYKLRKPFDVVFDEVESLICDDFVISVNVATSHFFSGKIFNNMWVSNFYGEMDKINVSQLLSILRGHHMTLLSIRILHI